MDGGGTRKFTVRISMRSLIFGVAAVALLLTTVIWNGWQSRLAREALARATAAERAAAQARADVERARAETQARPTPLKDPAIRRTARTDRDANGADRVRQLYEEINALTRIQGRIQEDLHNIRARSARRAASAQDGAP
jgi:hypothetical protein